MAAPDNSISFHYILIKHTVTSIKVLCALLGIVAIFIK
jgi:hypothetical protein